MFYREGLLAPRPTPKLEDHPLVGYPRLLIQFIRSYLKTRHDMVTGTHYTFRLMKISDNECDSGTNYLR